MNSVTQSYVGSPPGGMGYSVVQVMPGSLSQNPLTSRDLCVSVKNPCLTVSHPRFLKEVVR